MPANNPEPSDEDRFEASTMSFGEHLEELRICLFKALGGLAVGVLLGLFVGGWVVSVIQKPLTRALTKYYEIQAIEDLGPDAAKRTDSGGAPATAPKWFSGLVEQRHMLPQEVFIRRDELLEELGRAYPEQFKTARANAPGANQGVPEEDMVRVFLWHRTQDDPRIRLTALSAHEAFMVYIKASLLVGAILSSWWVFYQLWSFVAVGLYRHERRYVQVFLPFSLALFLGGAAMAFLFVFEPVLGYLFAFNRAMGIDPYPRITEWLGFVLMLPLGFGIAFQLPLVMLFLERIGVFTVQTYVARTRIALLLIVVLAAILTPPDPFSMLLLAGPLAALYFVGILLCKLAPRGRSLFQDRADS